MKWLGVAEENIISFHSESPYSDVWASVGAPLFPTQNYPQINLHSASVIFFLWFFFCQCLKQLVTERKLNSSLRMFSFLECSTPTSVSVHHVCFCWYCRSGNTSPSNGTSFKIWLLWPFWGHLSDIFHFNKTQGLNGKGYFPMTFLGNFASNYNLKLYILLHYL